MSQHPYILARTRRDAHSFAQDVLHLPRNRYRIVNTPSTLKSIRGADLHLVPGWQNRFDRFAMKGALRWTRMNIIEAHEGAVVEDRETGDRALLTTTHHPARDSDFDEILLYGLDSQAEPSQDGLNPPGVQLALIDGMISEGSPVQEDEDEPQVKRRRRRCKECGILVEPDDVDQHAEDHRNDLFQES